MKASTTTFLAAGAIAALAAGATTTAAEAAIIVSEVAPWGSASGTGYAADWFELTNTGTAAVDITAWRMDDNSNAFASSVALNGVTTIAAGESVVFIETASTATVQSFVTAWFGAMAPAGLQIGTYSGAGVGLSQTSDAVNVFTGGGALVTRVDFGATSAFATLDNRAGLSDVTIAALSAPGVNGAFTSASGNQIGSPGTIGAVPEVPSPALLLAGLATVAGITRRREARP